MNLSIMYPSTILNCLRIAIDIIGRGSIPGDIDEWYGVDGFDLNVWSYDGWIYGSLYEIDSDNSIVVENYMSIFKIKKI